LGLVICCSRPDDTEQAIKKKYKKLQIGTEKPICTSFFCLFFNSYEAVEKKISLGDTICHSFNILSKFYIPMKNIARGQICLWYAAVLPILEIFHWTAICWSSACQWLLSSSRQLKQVGNLFVMEHRRLVCKGVFIRLLRVARNLRAEQDQIHALACTPFVGMLFFLPIHTLEAHSRNRCDITFEDAGVMIQAENHY
jgi:hypothetical protein